jgi:TonB family protein
MLARRDGLDEEAIKAVQQWRFRPALNRGTPISMHTTVEVELRLKQKPEPKSTR